MWRSWLRTWKGGQDQATVRRSGVAQMQQAYHLRCFFFFFLEVQAQDAQTRIEQLEHLPRAKDVSRKMTAQA